MNESHAATEEPLPKRVLLLIPSMLKLNIAGAVGSDNHPRMDYYALADGLRAAGVQVDLAGYADVAATRHPLVRLASKVSQAAALAIVGFLWRRNYDAIFSNGENIGIPLAVLFKCIAKRPIHVCIGHRLSSRKKRHFFFMLRVDRQIDTLFVYTKYQFEYARKNLGIAAKRLRLIAFHADERFFRPMRDLPVDSYQVSAAGLEGRDYTTLIEAVRTTADIQLRLTAFSPWSKSSNVTQKYDLPENVSVRRYEYGELRKLYAQSSCVAIPLYETDFQAGITTMLEAMAMEKAVVVTETTGQRDVIVNGENGLTVAPGDIEGWRSAIDRLRRDPALRDRLGRNARMWVEHNATLDRWVADIVEALRASSSGG